MSSSLGFDRPEVIAGVGDDAALLLPSHPENYLVQTIDYFKSFLSDPFLLGKIIAIHSISDLHAMNAEPISALALCTLPYGIEGKVEDDLVQMLAGACQVLGDEKCSLVGGHTSEGAELAMGLSLHGSVHPSKVLQKGPTSAGQYIILTKPLGTGVIMAADMRALSKGIWVKEAISSMLLSNKKAAEVLQSFGCKACTDVTGFGLIGHLIEMLQYKTKDTSIGSDDYYAAEQGDFNRGANGTVLGSFSPEYCPFLGASKSDGSSQVIACLFVDQIPLLNGSLELLAEGISSSLHSQVSCLQPLLSVIELCKIFLFSKTKKYSECKICESHRKYS
jgi:selenium donor protein